VSILAGTDGIGGDGDNDMPNIHEEVALLVEKAGLSPMEALMAATATGAKVLGTTPRTERSRWGRQRTSFSFEPIRLPI
jgi:imidazolonepropionase-like amidohydrolase